MTDLLALLNRDHHDLGAGLNELLDAATAPQIRSALDGVRLGLAAHAEAEEIVLYGAVPRASARSMLERVVAHSRAAHTSQECALAAVVCSLPGSAVWRDRVRLLRDMVHQHAKYEEQTVVPLIRDLEPEIYESLAGQFATERLRQLSMLQPSAQFFVPDLAQAS
jgi:hemerythrin superfamily protein